MRVGSSPTAMGARSSIAPTTARVFHSSDASPQPTSPAWSVSTLTKTQLRICALTTTLLMAVIFIGLIHGIEAASAIHQQRCSGHVIGGVGTEKDDGVGHGFGRLQSSQRDGLLHAPTVIGLSVPLAPGHAHAYDARRNRIHPDAVRCQFTRHAAHQHFHAALGNIIRRDVRPWDVLHSRRSENDPTFRLCRHHRSCCRLRVQKSSFEIALSTSPLASSGIITSALLYVHSSSNQPHSRMISAALTSSTTSFTAMVAETPSRRPTATRPIAPNPPVIRIRLPFRQSFEKVVMVPPCCFDHPI